MAKVIWKYSLDLTDVQSISIPSGTEFLSVQVQNGKPVLWAKVDPDAPKLSRKIMIIGTGDPFNNADGMKYIGTFQIHGSLVFHVFI